MQVVAEILAKLFNYVHAYCIFSATWRNFSFSKLREYFLESGSVCRNLNFSQNCVTFAEPALTISFYAFKDLSLSFAFAFILELSIHDIWSEVFGALKSVGPKNQVESLFESFLKGSVKLELQVKLQKNTSNLQGACKKRKVCEPFYNWLQICLPIAVSSFLKPDRRLPF